MDTTISFGECLKVLLQIREWSASRLARKINVEPSYVRMWVRGERIPSLQSDYVQMISSALFSGLDLSRDKSVFDALRKFANSLGFDNNKSELLPEVITSILRNAQIYSLSRKPKKTSNLKKEKKQNNMADNRYIVGDEGFFPERNIPLCIDGRYSILCAILSVLNSCFNRRNNKPGDIIITFQSDSCIFEGYPVFQKAWNDAIKELMKNRWLIRCLYNISTDVKDSFKIVETIIEYSGYKDSFLPLYFPNYNISNEYMELLTIKNIGAFMLLNTEGKDCVDTALYYDKKSIINKLHMYATNMYRSAVNILIRFNDFSSYMDFLTVNCRKIGHLHAVSLDLYFYTIPLSIWRKYILGAMLSKEDTMRSINRIKELSMIFHEDMKKYKTKFICQLEAIELMVESSEYYYTYFNLKLTLEDIAEHLEYTVYLLKNYENFEIALVSENQYGIILHPVAWEVRGGRSVGIASNDMIDYFSYTYSAVTEETVADAFDNYFLDMWNKITPRYRDKEFVISWLEEKLSYIRDKIAEKAI